MEEYKLYKNRVILKFDSKSHIYSVKGKQVFGTTSIIGVLDKPALKYWAVNMAIGSLEKGLEPGVALDEIQIKQLLEEARRAHTITKNKSADIGTMIHKWVENYIEARVAKKQIPKRPVNAEMKNAIEGFFNWAKENKVQIVASEQKVYHTRYKYAGTLDLEAIVNGKRTIVDLKTSNAIYPEMFLQAAAYLKAREQETGKKYPGGVMILRLSKENKEKKIEAFEAVKDTKVDEHFRCFLYCLGIYRWKMAMKKENIINKANGIK